MYERVRAYVKKYHMLQEKDHVIAGVSGGADSVCLLFMLVKLQKEMRFGLTVVHIHHGLRGESADADENYVRALCEKLDVELLAFHEDVGRYAKEQKLTLEEAGRNVRRHIFEEVCHRKNGTRIALAHHQNDNAETLLWNLSRGCGLAVQTSIKIRSICSRQQYASAISAFSITYDIKISSILSNTISRWRAAIGSSSTIIVRYFFVFTICLPFCAFALKLICNFTSRYR